MIMCLKGRSTGTSMLIKSKFHHRVPSCQHSAKPNKNTLKSLQASVVLAIYYIYGALHGKRESSHTLQEHQGERESAQSGSYKLGYFCLEFCIYFPTPPT